MTQHEEQLRDAFETHENLAPDAAAVYARVQELSRAYVWRRRGAQVAGGAVLTAGLVAGVAVLPQFLPGQAANSAAALAPAAPAAATPSASPTVAGTPAQTEFDKDIAAYFDAGYGYDDAVLLAGIWKTKDDIGAVKAEAGRRLLAGETLPVQPHPNPTGSEEPLDPKTEAAYAAFFGAGYVWDDAVRLAKLWKIKDPSDAKVTAGKKLAAGQTLPFKPKPANVKQAKENKAVDKFFAAGYDVADAVKLAKLWKTADAYQAKIVAGKKLLAGQTLPIRP
ncbi:hypothetical protein ACWKSP_35625 [Micromonosporaceae bacterium Da 78-11]